MLGKLFGGKKQKHKSKSNQNGLPQTRNANSNSSNSSEHEAQPVNKKRNARTTQDDMNQMSQREMASQQRRVASQPKRHSHIPGKIQNASALKQRSVPVAGANRTRKSSKPKQMSTMGAAHLQQGTAANQRLQQLMNMRSGKDSKNRARSMNVRQNQADPKNRYPKKRRSLVHKEPRRHSMAPKNSEQEQGHAKHLKNRRESTVNRHPKVQYRVKNEVFVLYDYYQPVRIIGSGAYAVVCEALNTLTGKKCAIKKNKGIFDHITDARRILREIKLLMHFNHQDIIPLWDVVPCDSTEIDTYNDCYLVMPKFETTLAKVIRSKQKLTDRHYQFFLYQMLRGLYYMHSAEVIHRDLKPENILINGADCNVKITDFGLARGVLKDDNIEKPTEYVVTRWYRSPEVMCSAGFYDEKVDLWSLGCILAELILRRPLFPGQNYLDQLKIIFELMGTPKDLSWIKTPEAKRWVQKLKPHNGKPFPVVFEGASEASLSLLAMMLTMDPAQRCSAQDCLRDPFFQDLYRIEDEQICPKFDLSFEFEKSIKTKFGVRHMMYDALMSFNKSAKSAPNKQKKYPTAASAAASSSSSAGDPNNGNNNQNTSKSSVTEPVPAAGGVAAGTISGTIAEE